MLPFPKVMLCNTFQFASLEAAEISSLGVHKFGIVMSNYVLLVRYTLKFQKDYTILAKNGKNTVLCWIQSDVGILGNQKADAAAKSTLSICHCDETSYHRHVCSYNKDDI